MLNFKIDFLKSIKILLIVILPLNGLLWENRGIVWKEFQCLLIPEQFITEILSLITGNKLIMVHAEMADVALMIYNICFQFYVAVNIFMMSHNLTAASSYFYWTKNYTAIFSVLRTQITAAVWSSLGPETRVTITRSRVCLLSDSTRHRVASDLGAVAMVRFPQEVCTIHTCFKNILMVSGKQRSGSMKTWHNWM